MGKLPETEEGLLLGRDRETFPGLTLPWSTA